MLEKYNEENLEPKREFDNRRYNGGVLSFYHEPLKNEQEIELDISNFYAKYKGLQSDTIKKEDYTSKEKEIKEKIDRLLKNCSKRNLDEKFQMDNDLIELFRFYNEKCKENYDWGRYNYIRSLLINYMPYQNFSFRNVSVNSELLAEVEKLSKYDQFCNTIYARTSLDMLNKKIIYNKSNLDSKDKIMRFFEGEIENLKRISEIKFERFNLYNKKGYVKGDKKTQQVLAQRKDGTLIGLIEIIANEYKKSEYFSDILNLVINNFSTKELDYIDFVKTSDNIEYINIGYERTALEVNKVCSLVKSNELSNSLLTSLLSYNRMKSLRKTEENNELYMDIEVEHNMQYIVFKIKQNLLKGLNSEDVDEIKNDLSEKIKEIFNRLVVNEQTLKEDENFIKEYLHIISLKHRLKNKNNKKIERNKIKI